MAFKMVICPPNYQDDWPDRLREAIPDIDVHLCPTVGEAMEVIGDADAAFGGHSAGTSGAGQQPEVGCLSPSRAQGRLLPRRVGQP